MKVLDFGLAKMADSEIELTKSGTMVGTSAYMSPEQARGERVDARSDLYSLGAVLYRLCTNRLPFQGSSTMAILMALAIEEPPPVQSLNPGLPESLATLIHQLLSKEADARPKSAAEVVTRLQAIAREMSGSHAHTSTSQPQMAYIPMAVSVPPEAANPFADLDSSVTEVEANVPAPVPATATKPTRRKPGVFLPWAIAGTVAFAALVVGGVVIVIKNKDGSETRIDVPDGATVTVQEKGNPRPVARVPTTPVPTGATAPGLQKEMTVDPDRKAAAWAISRGGSVKVIGKGMDIKDAADLPKDHFTLTDINLQFKTVPDTEWFNLAGLVGLTGLNLEATSITDSGLIHLKGCKNLKNLTLAGTQVSDAGLAHLKELKKLTGLWLTVTAVTDAGMIHLKEHKNLTSLYLHGTQVTDAGLIHLEELKNLRSLSLGQTRVSDAGLVHLKELQGLKILDLRYTKVTDIGLVHLKEHKNLTSLNLIGTQVSDAGLVHLKELKNLTSLNLIGTQVSDAGLVHLKELKNLTSLGLNDAQVSDAGLVHLNELKNLTSLNLAGTQVTDAGLVHLKEFHELTYLELRSIKVTNRGMVHLKEHKNLTDLNLIGTQVTDAGLVHLKELKNLTHLELAGTQVTNTGLIHLKELKNLTSLNLEGTKVTDAGLKEFQAAVPGCRIQYDGGVIEPKK